MSIGTIVIIAIIVILLIGIAVTYNRLVSMRQRVNSAYSDINVQLERRHDLIPNLVETVKGYAAHERGVFDEVTQAISAGMSSTTALKGSTEEAQFH